MIPKFRAYCKSMGKLCDVVIINYMTGSITVEIDGTGYLLQSSDYDPMESTDLFDKNGKEIFEGDVVLVMSEGFRPDTAIVKSGNFGFHLECWDMDIFPERMNELELEITVLGNIHEHPYLVEV